MDGELFTRENVKNEVGSKRFFLIGFFLLNYYFYYRLTKFAAEISIPFLQRLYLYHHLGIFQEFSCRIYQITICDINAEHSYI